MNAIQRPIKADTKTIQAEPPSRFSPALREAVRLRVRNGLTITEACRAAGISDAWWYKSWLKPAFRNLYAEEQTAYIQEVECLRAGYKARAFEVAAELMHNAKSEQVRMRAVEFLAGGPAQPSVVVQVNNAAPGYQYARPTAADAARPVQIEGDADPA